MTTIVVSDPSTSKMKCPWCTDDGLELVPDDDGIVHTPGPCRICDGAAYHYNLSDEQRQALWADYLDDMISSHPQIGPLVHPPTGRKPLHPIRALELLRLLQPSPNGVTH